MTQNEIHINRISQDKINLNDGITWFSNLDIFQKREIIQNLAYFIQQAHPDKDSIDIGIKAAPVKETMTPVVIIKTTKSISIALNKIIALPDSELDKSFKILICIFRAADTKRREGSCKHGCSHEWHNLT
jgi:hypothetical protein